MINNGTLTLTKGILQTSYTAATAPWIRIPNNTTTVSPSGGSANSYVDGYIRKTGNGSFIFPTGNSGYYRRIEISAPSASTEFEARYIRSAYSNTTSMSATPTVLNHVSLVEYWMLSKPLGADAATAKVKLYWENASQSGILKFDSLAVARWNGSSWENTNCYTGCPANWTSSTTQRTYTGSATGSGAGTIQSNTVSSFSPFTFSSIGTFNPNPLPINLVDFLADLHGGITHLDWTTETETNNDYFTVEKTRDGLNYETVGTVKGAGNSNEMLNYHFLDLNPYLGVSYYRLKQTDFDQQCSYSSLVAVNNTMAPTGNLLVSPNPFTTNVIFNFLSDAEGQAVLKIYDATGRLVAARTELVTAGTNAISLDISDLSRGVYFATVLLPGKDLDMKKVVILRE
jgi:hypothetical protein